MLKSGSEMEYFKLIKGEMPCDKENIFEGINTTWTRVKRGNKIKEIFESGYPVNLFFNGICF